MVAGSLEVQSVSGLWRAPTLSAQHGRIFASANPTRSPNFFFGFRGSSFVIFGNYAWGRVYSIFVRVSSRHTPSANLSIYLSMHHRWIAAKENA